MELDAANNARDARLRKRMLDAAHRARIAPMGGINAETLIDSVNAGLPPSKKIEDEQLAIGLLRDLQNAGYITLDDKRTHRHQRQSLEWLFVKITAKGSQMSLEKAPVDPLIDDGRRDGSEAD